MNINRNNYEEYFLLYIDNELSVEQKRQVELFIKENPDLEEELVMLQQSRLIPDNTIVFDKKQSLMREENSFININNYEEWLVLYLDDQLTEEEKATVEKFATAHPHVQQELALFAQTKLQPEKIVFADKKTLYRQEKIAVISLQWWKIAVAAMLVIAAGITLYSILINRNNGGVLTDDIVKKEVLDGANHISPDKKEQSIPIIKEEKEKIVQKGSKKEKEKRENSLANNDMKKTEPNIDRIKYDVTAVNPSTTLAESKIKNTISFEPKQIIKDPSVTNEPSQTPEPIYVINTDTESKKLRGFFRKATRLIERTTNIKPADDDNKVLIGGMAINLK